LILGSLAFIGWITKIDNSRKKIEDNVKKNKIKSQEEELSKTSSSIFALERDIKQLITKCTDNSITATDKKTATILNERLTRLLLTLDSITEDSLRDMRKERVKYLQNLSTLLLKILNNSSIKS